MRDRTSTHAAAGVKCTTKPSRFVWAALSTNDGSSSLASSAHVPGGSENLKPSRSEPAARLPRMTLPGSAPRTTPAEAENSKLATKSCQSTFVRVERVLKLRCEEREGGAVFEVRLRWAREEAEGECEGRFYSL